jgi:hypothetical protein
VEPNPRPDEEAERRIAQAQDNLEAKLLAPLPPLVTPAPPSSTPSEMEALRDLLGTVVQRVDQLARTLAEVFSRQSQVNDQALATMRLMQEMIARSDELQQTQGDQIDQLVTLVAATVKINANLSEIVAALLGKDNNNSPGA